jgi:hypothetical protein
MLQKLFIRVVSGLLLFVLCGAFAASAQEPVLTGESSSVSDASISQAALPEISPLPIQLNEEQASAPQLLSFSVPHVTHSIRCMCNGFYRSAHNHPLTPREGAMRDAVYGFRKNTHQFVHVELKDGKVFTGNVAGANTQNFELKTGILYGFKTISYSQLAETPRAVPAVGTKVVHALEWTGVGAICVAAIPLFVALLPLMMMGVLSD